MIGSELLRYDRDRKYLIFDDETENLNTVYGLPWQISFLIATQKEILETHDYYPYFSDLTMSRDAARITRFSMEEYKQKGHDPKEVLDIFDSYLYNDEYTVIFHNGLNFDSMVHQTFRRKLGKKVDYSFLNRCIDTNAICKAMKKGIKPPAFGSPDFLPFQYRMQTIVERGLKTNLTQMGKEFGIEFDYNSTHRGANDIILNYEVFKKLIWAVEI